MRAVLFYRELGRLARARAAAAPLRHAHAHAHARLVYHGERKREGFAARLVVVAAPAQTRARRSDATQAANARSSGPGRTNARAGPGKTTQRAFSGRAGMGMGMGN